MPVAVAETNVAQGYEIHLNSHNSVSELRIEMKHSSKLLALNHIHV